MFLIVFVTLSKHYLMLFLEEDASLQCMYATYRNFKKFLEMGRLDY